LAWGCRNKSFRNLKKAAGNWHNQAKAGNMTEHELITRILESRVARHFRDTRGRDFREEEFLSKILDLD